MHSHHQTHAGHTHHDHGASACCQRHAQHSSHADRSCCAVTHNTTAISACDTTPSAEHSASDGGESGDSGDPDGSDSDASPASGVRFSWIIRGMDCPSCAKKIENAITPLPGVIQASVRFATEKLIVDAQSDIRTQIQRAVEHAGFTWQDTSPGATAPTSSAPAETPLRRILREHGFLLLFAVLTAVSGILSLFSPRASEIAFIATTLLGLIPLLGQAIKLIRSGTPFAIETLMSVAALGALLIGATSEATMVILLFMLGERLEAYAAQRARRGVSALMALMPETATVIRAGQRTQVSIAALQPGDVIEVAPGSRLPADGELLVPHASFDESALTGESLPVEREQGDKVSAGSLSVDRLIQLRVISEPGNSAIDRILHLIEEAESHRAPIERFLDRFSRYYTPAIMLLAAATIVVPPLLFGAPWQEWIYRGLTLLLIGCPCALVISTPAAITSGLAAAARRGALIKGGAALEILGTINTIAFDKTGTLTQGKPQVTDAIPTQGVSTAALLARAAAIEAGSHHPLAKAIVQHARTVAPMLPVATAQRALAGVGVEGVIAGKTISVKAPAKIAPEALDADWRDRIHTLESDGKTVVVVQEETQIIGLLALRDTLRADTPQAIEALRTLGIRCTMLTGDNPRSAAAIAATLGIDYKAGLLPADKVDAVREMNQTHPTAMVGDGINDAPAMKSAAIGIAMGGGSDVALETADAALTHNRLSELAGMIRLSRATRNNIRQNITLALGLKAIFLVTSLLGLTGLWLAVLADSGATALVTANALRLLRREKPQDAG